MQPGTNSEYKITYGSIARTYSSPTMLWRGKLVTRRSAINPKQGQPSSSSSQRVNVAAESQNAPVNVAALSSSATVNEGSHPICQTQESQAKDMTTYV